MHVRVLAVYEGKGMSHRVEYRVRDLQAVDKRRKTTKRANKKQRWVKILKSMTCPLSKCSDHHDSQINAPRLSSFNFLPLSIKNISHNKSDKERMEMLGIILPLLLPKR